MRPSTDSERPEHRRGAERRRMVGTGRDARHPDTTYGRKRASVPAALGSSKLVTKRLLAPNNQSHEQASQSLKPLKPKAKLRAA